MVASKTSGPMPSPGSRSSLYSFISEGPSYCLVARQYAFFAVAQNLPAPPALLKPGRLAVLAFLEAGDLVLGPQGQSDVVPAVHQHLLAESIHLELDHAAVGTADLLLLQVDRDDG